MNLRAVFAVTAATLLAATGCSATAPSTEQTPTPTTVPTLSDPIELDSLSSVVVDDGVGRALITDWNAQKVRVIDATGSELWSRDTLIDDERGGAEAYLAGENVISMITRARRRPTRGRTAVSSGHSRCPAMRAAATRPRDSGRRPRE